MKKRRRIWLLLLSCLQCFAFVKPSQGATYVWLVVGVPSARPRLDSTFTTPIGISSWNGVPGAVDISIRHNPRTLELVDASPEQNSTFLQAVYFNSDSSSSGLTRLAMLQWNNAQAKETLYVVGKITWKVIGIADSTTDITVDIADVVDAARAPVEVFAFGQHIDFRLSTGTSVGSDMNMPTTYELDYNYPNPFNPSTKILYQVPENVHVSIMIYNILGQRIRKLVNEVKQRGRYVTEWNGENDSGHVVGTGVYFYRMDAGKFQESKKMLLLR